MCRFGDTCVDRSAAMLVDVCSFSWINQSYSAAVRPPSATSWDYNTNRLKY